MIYGMLGKFGPLFVTIPDPIIGGVFMVRFGMITAVGISDLQYADINSSRNLFIVGFSLVFGLAVPYYLKDHMDAIQTGIGVWIIMHSKSAQTLHLSMYISVKSSQAIHIFISDTYCLQSDFNGLFFSS